MGKRGVGDDDHHILLEKESFSEKTEKLIKERFVSIRNKGVVHMQGNILNFLKDYASKKSVFKDKKVFHSSYKPTNIIHREDLVEQMAKILAPSLKREKPSNLFIYGKTGSGKTLSIKYVTGMIIDVAKSEKIPIKTIYLNCKLKRVSDTEYRLIAQISRELGRSIPPTGLPTDEVYSIFCKTMEHLEQRIILVLDEIDQLTKKTGSEILYNLTRLNEELLKSSISFIGISNDLNFSDALDPRVKSSLSEEEIVFPPYDAVQISDILGKRSVLGFAENVLEQGVVQKCAAHAAREHGDARRAIDLLRVAGELADRENSDKVKLKHVNEAESKIDRDRLSDTVSGLPKQAKATIMSVIVSCSPTKNRVFTGDCYEKYTTICKKSVISPLTQRRFSDIISEMDMLGVITAKVVYKGRYGRTREISVPKALDTPNIRGILQKELNL